MSAVAETAGLTSPIDARTLEILDHRRRARPFRSRGALIRRLLLAADLIGLTLAFTVTELIVGGGNEGISTAAEFGVFFLTLPAWIVLARLYRLYDHDEERTGHTTADDVVGVFHLVTVTTWALWIIGAATGVVHADPTKTAIFWALRPRLRDAGPHRRTVGRPPQPLVRPELRHRRGRRRRAAAGRARSSSTPSTASTWWASSTRSRSRAAPRSST